MTFMANERVASEDAVAGDIIGIHNHGQLQIGDTLTEGEALLFKGIPYFAPELFRVARPRDPFKAKQLQKGLQQLGEEGAIQVFETTVGNTLLLGAVGQLQFEVVAARLASEYKVDAHLRRRRHRDRALAHLSRRQDAARLREGSRRIARDRRRRQPRLPGAQPLQPAGGDGALAQGRLPRHPRTRSARRARVARREAVAAAAATGDHLLAECERSL